ncbi:hypothetical protein PINS_up014763 [Pythium insidiosum]|nr:hypothetical protein PINS_up014763 [Pythium insidiosum]
MHHQVPRTYPWFEDEVAPALDCYPSPLRNNEPHVNGEWKELSGRFHFFWGMNVSHGASDAHVAPGAAIDDGYYYLVCAPAPFSKFELTKLLLGLDHGTHVNQANVHLIRTRAFTLHVDNPTDLVVVDGEVFRGPHLQVEVHRALARIMCL